MTDNGEFRMESAIRLSEEKKTKTATVMSDRQWGINNEYCNGHGVTDNGELSKENARAMSKCI